MYRSNDIVQINPRSIFIRPFVKVGELPENVKIYQYFLADDYKEIEVTEEAGDRQDLNHYDGPRRGHN